jgi:plastocyanin
MRVEIKTVAHLAVALIAGTAACIAASSPGAATEACRTIHEVEITYAFNPGDIYVKKGDCVHFTNVHVIEHSAVGLEREFNTGILMPGSTALIPFDEEGAIPFVCGVHPLMVGVVVVEPQD